MIHKLRETTIIDYYIEAENEEDTREYYFNEEMGRIGQDCCTPLPGHLKAVEYADHDSGLEYLGEVDSDDLIRIGLIPSSGPDSSLAP
jgi:hypothetical protein